MSHSKNFKLTYLFFGGGEGGGGFHLQIAINLTKYVLFYWYHFTFSKNAYLPIGGLAIDSPVEPILNRLSWLNLKEISFNSIKIY